MTQEQKMHQDEYDRAKRRYESAYMDKRNAENELAGIKTERRQILDKINQQKTERKRFSESSDEIAKTSQNDSDISEGIADSETKLEAAATGFCAIGSTTSSKPQNLTAVFEERDRSAKNTISTVFENLRKTVENCNIEYDNKKIKITITAGISFYQKETSLNLILKKADLLLYKGKELGRNQVIYEKSDLDSCSK